MKDTLSDSSIPDGHKIFSFELGDNTEIVRVPTDPDEINQINARNFELRQRIINETTPNEEGLNLQRIADFVKQNGLRMSTFLVVPGEDETKIKSFLQDEGLGIKLPYINGQYLPTADLAIVYRDGHREVEVGPEAVEATIVHEAAGHGSATIMTTLVGKVDDETRYINTRFGQGVDGERGWSGTFLEEGFAAQLEFRYKRDGLGLEHGFYGEPASTLVDHGFFSGDKSIIMPLKYGIRADNVNDQFSPSSLAAYGIELLIKKDPTLWDSMIKARTQVEGLREVARKIENLSPGLYRKLLGIQYEDIQFTRGTRAIIDALYDGDPRAAIDGLL